jgi:hypothetical protein
MLQLTEDATQQHTRINPIHVNWKGRTKKKMQNRSGMDVEDREEQRVTDHGGLSNVGQTNKVDCVAETTSPPLFLLFASIEQKEESTTQRFRSVSFMLIVFIAEYGSVSRLTVRYVCIGQAINRQKKKNFFLVPHCAPLGVWDPYYKSTRCGFFCFQSALFFCLGERMASSPLRRTTLTSIYFLLPLHFDKRHK